MKTNPKISRYGTAALALAGGAMGLNDTQAAIAFTEVTSGGTIPSGSVNLWFDIGEDESGAWSSVPIPGADFRIVNSDPTFILFQATPNLPYAPYFINDRGRELSGAGYTANVASGTPIGNFMPWTKNSGFSYYGNGNFPKDGTHGYVGLRVEPTVGSYRYGWAEVSYNASGSVTLYGFAVELTGSYILAGQTTDVPEPAETGLVMALLAGGAAAWRRRQAFKRAA